MTGLVSLVYDAVLDPGRWSHFLATLATELGGASIGMSLRHPRLGDPGWIVFHDTDPAYDFAYQQRYFGIDPFRARSAALVPGTCEMMAGGTIAARTLARSEFYNEWMRPQGWLPSPSLGVTLDRDAQGEPIGLGIFRPRGARAYGDRELRLLRVLIPSLQQATRLALRLADSDAQLAATCDALEMLPVAAVLVDPAGNAVRANGKAHALAEVGDAATSRHGRLALQPAVALALRRLATARAGGARPSDDAIIVRRGTGRAPLRLHAVPCSTRQATGEDGRRGYFWVLIEDPEHVFSPSAAALEAQLGLTTAEARLCALLVSGRRLDEAAAELQVGHETVRSQLKSAFRKTGARSQSDLIRMLLQRPTLARGENSRQS